MRNRFWIFAAMAAIGVVGFALGQQVGDAQKSGYGLWSADSSLLLAASRDHTLANGKLNEATQRLESAYQATLRSSKDTIGHVALKRVMYQMLANSPSGPDFRGNKAEETQMELQALGVAQNARIIELLERIAEKG